MRRSVQAPAMGLAAKFAFILAFLAVGVAARVAGPLTPSRRDLLNGVAFYVALPALVFVSTYGRSLRDLVSWPLLLGYWATVAATLSVAWVVHRNVADPAARSVAIVQSYHGNLGYLGLPIVATSFGGLTAAKASVVLGVGALTQVPVTVFLFTAVTGVDRALREEATTFFGNPVLLALAAGVAAGETGLVVPASVLSGLDAVSELALPLALLAVGGSLAPRLDAVRSRTLAGTIALKTVVMPVVALAAFGLLSPARSTLRAGVVMLGMPTAVSTYVYASELGGDRELASLTVFVTTVVSTGTLFCLLTVLS